MNIHRETPADCLKRAESTASRSVSDGSVGVLGAAALRRRVRFSLVAALYKFPVSPLPFCVLGCVELHVDAAGSPPLSAWLAEGALLLRGYWLRAEEAPLSCDWLRESVQVAPCSQLTCSKMQP